MQHSKPIEKLYFIMNSSAAEKIAPTVASNIYVHMEVPQCYPNLQAESIAPFGEYASCIGIAISSLEG